MLTDTTDITDRKSGNSCRIFSSSHCIASISQELLFTLRIINCLFLINSVEMFKSPHYKRCGGREEESRTISTVQFQECPGTDGGICHYWRCAGQDVMLGPTLGMVVRSTYGGALCLIIFLTLTRLITPSLAHDTSARLQIDDLQPSSNSICLLPVELRGCLSSAG